MMVATIMTLASASLIIIMLVWATIKNKALPYCVSDCYYIIGLPFTIVFAITSWLMLYPTILCWESPVTIGMIFALSLVGVAADYNDKDYHFEHVAGAVIAALLSVVFVLHTNPTALFCYVVALLGIADRKRWLLYAELACFASVWVAILS